MLTYNSKFVATIRASGKILREFGDTVYLPFGSEYSIVLKNLNTVRALVNIYIDGKDVVSGGLVMMPGQTVDLERWVTAGSLAQGNKFKFIERTSKIEAHRGITIEDGLVRIVYKFESPTYNRTLLAMPVQDMRYADPYIHNLNTGLPANSFITPVSANSVNTQVSDSASVTASTGTLRSLNAPAPGITVPGGVSNQQFCAATSFLTEDKSHCIILRLSGEVPDQGEVSSPVTVKTKPKCVTCGHTNKASAKFCSECGTGLVIV